MRWFRFSRGKHEGEKPAPGRKAPPSSSPEEKKEPAGAQRSREQIIGELAGSICRRGMGSSAIFLLESVRPLNFVGSQLLHALGPMASLLIEPQRWEEFAQVLEERDSLDQLIARIEAKEQESSPPKS